MTSDTTSPDSLRQGRGTNPGPRGTGAPSGARLPGQRRAAIGGFARAHIDSSPHRFSEMPAEYWADRYDCAVAGSDQVWNPTYRRAQGIDFLDFLSEPRRIAYARELRRRAGAGFLRSRYRAWLRGIPHLSVRESTGRRIVADLTGRDVPVVLDPTLLVERSVWDRLIEQREPITDGPYAVRFFLGRPTPTQDAWVRRHADDAGLAGRRPVRPGRGGVRRRRPGRLRRRDRACGGRVHRLISRGIFALFHRRPVVLRTRFHRDARWEELLSQNESVDPADGRRRPAVRSRTSTGRRSRRAARASASNRWPSCAPRSTRQRAGRDRARERASRSRVFAPCAIQMRGGWRSSACATPSAARLMPGTTLPRAMRARPSANLRRAVRADAPARCRGYAAVCRRSRGRRGTRRPTPDARRERSGTVTGGVRRVAAIPGHAPIDRHERALLRQAHDELPVLGEEPAVEAARSLVGRSAHQKAARRIHEVGQEQVLEMHVGGAVARDEASVAEVLTPAHVPGKVAGIQHVPVAVDVLGEHERPGRIGSTVECVDERRERLRVPEVVGVEEQQILGMRPSPAPRPYSGPPRRRGAGYARVARASRRRSVRTMSGPSSVDPSSTTITSNRRRSGRAPNRSVSPMNRPPSYSGMTIVTTGGSVTGCPTRVPRRSTSRQKDATVEGAAPPFGRYADPVHAPLSTVVVIATYRRPDYVEECLSHLERQTVAPSRIVVVDASPDELTRGVVARHPGVEYRRNPRGHRPHRDLAGDRTRWRRRGHRRLHRRRRLRRTRLARAAPRAYADPDVAAVGGRARNGQPDEEHVGASARSGSCCPTDGSRATSLQRPTGWSRSTTCSARTCRCGRASCDELGGIRDFYPGTCLREETDIALRMRRRGCGSSTRRSPSCDHVGGSTRRGRRFDSRYRYFGARNHVVLLATSLGWRDSHVRILRPNGLRRTRRELVGGLRALKHRHGAARSSRAGRRLLRALGGPRGHLRRHRRRVPRHVRPSQACGSIDETQRLRARRATRRGSRRASARTTSSSIGSSCRTTGRLARGRGTALGPRSPSIDCRGRSRGKVLMLPGDHADPARFVLRLETEQRQAALDAASEGADWVIQLDTDEILPTLGVRRSARRARSTRAEALEFPARIFYARTPPGGSSSIADVLGRRVGLSRAGRGSSGNTAVVRTAVGGRAVVPRRRGALEHRPRPPAVARCTRVIHPRDAILHMSWVRTEAQMAEKWLVSGHAGDPTGHLNCGDGGRGRGIRFGLRSAAPLCEILCRRFRVTRFPVLADESSRRTVP